MTDPVQGGVLFTRLLRGASLRANEILSVSGGAARVRAIGDDGFCEIERLNHSPFVGDQFVALALRLSASDRGAGQPLVTRMCQFFQTPAASIEVEAMRKSIWSEQESSGLPLAAARREVAKVETSMTSSGRERCTELRDYASLYSRMWCDPRMGTAAETRRLMLAMVTVFASRSNAFRGGGRMSEVAISI